MDSKFLQFICAGLLFFSLQIYGQITYKFDKLLMYNTSNFNDSISGSVQYIMVNSKDNSYYAHLWEKDSTTYRLYFRDNDSLNFDTEINKSEFFKAEYISTDCDGVSTWGKERLAKRMKKLNKLEIHQFQDTIINSLNYKYFRIKDKKKKTSKVYSYRYYILDETISSDRPIIIDPTDYTLWKLNDLPKNGVIKEFGLYDKEKDSFYKRRLDSIYAIDKKIVIPEDCPGAVKSMIIIKGNLP